MSNPNQAPSAWNAEPKLGGFVPNEAAHPQTEQLSIVARVRRFTDWAFSAALTAPSVSSVGSSEHFQHDPTDRMAA